MSGQTRDTADHSASGSGSGGLVVRLAQAEDRAAVMALCERIWGEDDYIPWVWDDWLREQQAGRDVLLVGVQNGHPAGIIHLRMVSEDEGWIEGIRVDPDMRRRGIARALVSKALGVARDRGAGVVRLFVDADNHASHGLVARFGFTRVAELARYAAPTLGSATAEQVGIQLATPGAEQFERIWSWLEQSNLTPFNGGLEIADWAARAVTEPLLRAHLAAGEVWVLQDWGTIQALAIATDASGYDTDDKDDDATASLEVRYLDGASEGIGRIALALRHVAGARGLARVRLWLPTLLILQDAMAGAGYTRPADDEPLSLYARELQS